MVILCALTIGLNHAPYPPRSFALVIKGSAVRVRASASVLALVSGRAEYFEVCEYSKSPAWPRS